MLSIAFGDSNYDQTISFLPPVNNPKGDPNMISANDYKSGKKVMTSGLQGKIILQTYVNGSASVYFHIFKVRTIINELV